MTTHVSYISNDFRSFNSEEACLAHEKQVESWKLRLQELSTMDTAALEKLCSDLDQARRSAYNFNIIDTMGSAQARAIYYMNNVCQSFLKEHDGIRMV